MFRISVLLVVISCQYLVSHSLKTSPFRRDVSSQDVDESDIVEVPESMQFDNDFRDLLQNQVQVTCDPNSMCITITRAFYELRGFSKVDFGSLKLTTPCNQSSVNGDDKMKTICTGLMTCGTNMALNSTHVIFRNKVTSFDVQNTRYPGVVIGQWSEHVLPWECVYPLDYLVSITSQTQQDDFYFSPMMSQIRTIMIDTSSFSGIGHGEFPVGMFLFKSSSYDSVHSEPPEYSMNSRLYVGISLLEGPKVAVIEVERCWSTPTNNTEDDSNLQLIQNYCPIDIIDVETKSTTRHFRFNSEIFRFPSSPRVYLHCFVTVCFSDRQFCNKVSQCNGASRKRRSMNNEKGFRETILSVGPIYVSDAVNDDGVEKIKLEESFTPGVEGNLWLGNRKSLIYILVVFGVTSLCAIIAVIVLVSRRYRRRM